MKKTTKNIKRRNNLILLAVLSLLLAGCSSAKTEEGKEEAATVQVETNEKEVVAEVETECVAEIETESVTENVEETEVATYETAMDWAIAVNGTIPELTIWNSLTKQGIVLENAQKYLVKEGDMLVLCGNFEGALHTDIDAPILNEVLSTSIHQEYEFTEIPAGETEISILLKVNEEEYELSLIIMSENATATVSDSETTEVSGKDWANSLEYDEPKLVAWNDETGTKEVIEQGGKYVMQQGDILGVYYPTGYFVVTALPYDFFQGFTVLSKVCIMDYKLPSEAQDINLEVEVLNEKSESGTYNFIITTP